MGFEFAETMAGTVEWDAEPGVRHPFRFEITAHAASTRAHLRDGKAAIRGIVYAPPLADARRRRGHDHDPARSASGSSATSCRSSRDDGKRYELVGQKDIRWLRRSQTFTDAARRDPRRGPPPGRDLPDHGSTLRNDWWCFLRSFRPVW